MGANKNITLSKYGKKKGRPTKKEQLEKAIEKANSKELEISLQAIRLEIIKQLKGANDDPTVNRVRSEDVKNLHSIYKTGKDVLHDLLREEASNGSNDNAIAKMLEEADSVVGDMGWDDDK